MRADTWRSVTRTARCGTTPRSPRGCGHSNGGQGSTAPASISYRPRSPPCTFSRPTPALQQSQPLHATHAELLSRAGHRPAAAHAYRRAITLTQNAVARAELERRLHGLTNDPRWLEQT